MKGFKKKIIDFINSEKEAPFLLAFICGFTPMIFHYANNYWAINSWLHLGYFTLTFLGTSFLICLFVYHGFKSIKALKEYVSHALLIFLLLFAFIFLWYTFFMTTKRGIALFCAISVAGYFLWRNPRRNYKKIMVFFFAFSSLSFFRTIIHIYEDIKPDYWLIQSDEIESVQFKTFPNVYMIQPDGYVAQSVMEISPYNYESDLYDWLRNNEFKVYDDFRSNYPASLTSNASLFNMKHHKFGGMIFPEIEMANARESITTSNPVATIFKNNGYKTYFIAEDEYFQQNKKQEVFDFYNIALDDFPLNSKGDDTVKDVLADLKLVMHTSDEPKFFFVEKLLPHHVGFKKTDESLAQERDKYIKRIKEVNLWLKTIINYITEQDENSVIIILADHGGWVGLKSFNHLFSANDPKLITSTFSNISAIKWNGNLIKNYDKSLKTNVNIFRVLFAALSKDPKYLESLEDDSSYNLRLNSLGIKRVKKLIDAEGRILQ